MVRARWRAVHRRPDRHRPAHCPGRRHEAGSSLRWRRLPAGREVPPADSPPPGRANVPARRQSPARPAGPRSSWSGPGGARRARPAGFPAPAAAAPPAPAARRPGAGRSAGIQVEDPAAGRASDLRADDGAHGRPRGQRCRTAPADRAGQSHREQRLPHARQHGPRPGPPQAARARFLQGRLAGQPDQVQGSRRSRATSRQSHRSPTDRGR
jgi:hypothetical protein